MKNEDVVIYNTNTKADNTFFLDIRVLDHFIEGDTLFWTWIDIGGYYENIIFKQYWLTLGYSIYK